ncbi:MAG: hypothetical protein ABTQ25_15215 [Nitrosomonas ureae]
MIIRYLLRISTLFLLSFLLAGCGRPNEKINLMIKTLPVPADARLLIRQDGTRQGSEDACFFPYTKLLYGTSHSLDDVTEFYTTILMSASWQSSSDALVSSSALSWKKDKGFQLSLRFDPDLDFPIDAVNQAKMQYTTVYYLVISYADRLARTKCLGGKD